MLALIAGRGALPVALCDALPQRPFVCALTGELPDITVDLEFRVEHLGRVFEVLKQKGISHVCFAGAIARPSLDPHEVDPLTMPFVPRFMEALTRGDDGALRIILDVFEDAGFDIKAAHDIAPNLLLPQGVYHGQLTPNLLSDAKLAEQCLAQMGARDLGQACVVQAGQVLAQEDARGTDALIAGLDAGTTLDAVFFKGPKPNQDMRVDMPVIGLDTVENLAQRHVRSIVIEAGGVMVLSQERVLEALSTHDMTLWVRPRGYSGELNV